jgi:hypothetical protein
MKFLTTLAILTIAFSTGELSAQVGPMDRGPSPGIETRGPDSAAANRCRAAAAVMSSQAQLPEAQALDFVWSLRFCDVTGIEALVRAWERPAMRSAAIDALVGVSRELHDRRLVEPVLSLAVDESESEELRLSTLLVLGAYLIPGARTGSDGWYGTGEEPSTFGPSSHFSWYEGEEPIEEADKERILTALRVLEDESENSRIQKVAHMIRVSYEFYSRRS